MYHTRIELEPPTWTIELEQEKARKRKTYRVGSNVTAGCKIADRNAPLNSILGHGA
jgi:hypothetical protein